MFYIKTPLKEKSMSGNKKNDYYCTCNRWRENRMEDKIILGRIRESDKAAFETIVKRYYTTLCSFACHIVKDRQSAEDIVQEVFVKLWTGRNHSAEISSLKDYLFVSTRNSSLNHIRSDKRQMNRLRKMEQEEEENIWPYVVEEETSRLLLEAIAQLPARSAEVMRLSLEGLSLEKIAGQMNISVNTVKSLKYEAIRKLRNLLGPLIYLFLHMRKKKL